MKKWIQILYPLRCPGCDELLSVREAQIGFCAVCQQKIIYLREPLCKHCGKQLQSYEKEFCFDCTEKRFFFDQGKALFAYAGPLKNAMYRLKYSNRRCYASLFAQMVNDRMKSWFLENEFDVIIPVPMHKEKKKLRGYNQAEVLAEQIGKKMNLRVQNNLVIRQMNTAPQKGLTDSMRKENLKNAFILTENVVQFKHILIIDDIYTTGSTVNEVAKLLKGAGALSICCLYICVGRGY